MDLQEMLRQAQSMQNKVEAVRAEAAKKTVEGSAGGGMVQVTASGDGRLRAVKIERDLVDPEEIEMLQDLILIASNQALERAQALMEQEMAPVAGNALQGLSGMF